MNKEELALETVLENTLLTVYDIATKWASLALIEVLIIQNEHFTQSDARLAFMLDISMEIGKIIVSLLSHV